jgi:hypothetical protein
MKPYVTLFAIALVGCTNGQGEIDVTSTNVATFPGASVDTAGQALSAEALTSDASVTLDVQKDIASLSDVGKLTAAVSKNTISGSDLAFVRHIKVTMATEDGKIPAEVVSDAELPANSTEAELALLISNSKVLEYLSEGKVDVHFYLTGGIPDRPLVLTHTLTAHMSIAVQGSVLKF